MASTWWIFMKFDIWEFFENLSRKLKFHYNQTRITGPLHGGQCTSMTLSHWILGRMRNVQKIKIYILCSITFSWKSCHLWDNVRKYGRVGCVTCDNIIWCMWCACQITKATNTHSEYVITYCLSKATMVMWTCLNFTLYVHYPPCCISFHFHRITIPNFQIVCP